MSLADMSLHQAITARHELQEPELDILSYASFLADSMRLDTNKLPVSALMVEGKLVMQKPDVNKLLFELKETIPAVETDAFSAKLLEENKESIIKNSTGDLEESLETEKNRSKEYNRTLESKLEDVAYYTKLVRDSHNLALSYEKMLAEGRTDDTVFNEIKAICDSGKYQLLAVNGGTLLLATTESIKQSLVNPAAGIDCTINFGALMVRLCLITSTVKVYPFLSNTYSNGFYHTHVSSSGSICWGDAKKEVQDCLQSKKYVRVFELLSSLLTNYNDDNPYAELPTWERSGSAHWKSSAIRNNSSYAQYAENYTKPADLPVRRKSAVPYDVTSDLYPGQLIRIKGRFDSGVHSSWVDRVCYVTDIKDGIIDNSQENSNYNNRRIRVNQGFALKDDGSIGYYTESSSTWVTRDEVEPVAHDDPFYIRWMEIRDELHRRGRLCVGDTVYNTSNEKSGGYYHLIGEDMIVTYSEVATVAMSYPDYKKYLDNLSNKPDTASAKVRILGGNRTTQFTRYVKELRHTNPAIDEIVRKECPISGEDTKRIVTHPDFTEGPDGYDSDLCCPSCDSEDTAASDHSEETWNGYCYDCGVYFNHHRE